MCLPFVGQWLTPVMFVWPKCKKLRGLGWFFSWQYRKYKRKISKEQIEIGMEHGRKHLFHLVDAELATVSIML